MKSKFKILLNLGGNYVLQNRGFTVNQVLPDFTLEFFITKDRKLKGRLYAKYDLDPVDPVNATLRQKYGVGVAYRTEFGSMLDFEQNVKNAVIDVLNDDKSY
jgi:hypothetical protein